MRMKSIACILIVCLAVAIVPAVGSGKGNKLPEPHPGKDGKFRIAYVESETYVNYAATLDALVDGLEEDGWLSGSGGMPYEIGQNDTKSMWDWLSSHDLGTNIEFVPDAYFSLKDAEKSYGAKYPEVIASRLGMPDDIDLIIVMGTKAGLTVTGADLKVPSMVFSSSNPVRSGIIKSADDSGSDYVWAHVDPGRYKRQVEVFHDLVGFKRLGIFYEDSEAGRAIVAVDDVEETAKDEGFQLVARHILEPVSDADVPRYLDDVTSAVADLADEVDAVYLTMGLWSNGDLPRILRPLNARGIPVFSQLGTEEVQGGVLMSVARADFAGIGMFGAENIALILDGESPRKLEQAYEDSAHIALNMKTARLIGFKPDFEMLLAADEIY